MKIEQKNNLMSNIDHLAKVRKIKKSDLETKAGVSKGYLSRFKNDDPNNLPSISFIESVAEQLHVTIDTLLNCELRDTTVLYDIQLLKKLVLDTDNRTLEWAMGDSDIKMTQLKKSQKEDPFFSIRDISYNAVDEVEPCYNEDGFKEGYMDSSGEYRDVYDTDTITESHLIFKPSIPSAYELWGDSCCEPFVDGRYYWTELDSNTKLFLLNMASYENGQALNDGEWQQATLWIVGDEADLLLEEEIIPMGIRYMFADLENAIIRSKNTISKENQKALDNYLNNK